MAAELRFRAMGSDAHVIVLGDPRLADLARERIDDLEQRWSRFIPTSEISRMNAARGVEHIVSSDTFALVEHAVAAWARTDGRFDPTVLGDLVRAGYDRPYLGIAVHRAGGASVLRRNAAGIRTDAGRSAVTLPPDAGFDLGGIGKGFAADIVVAELMASGAEGACVNLGGDLRVEGTGPAAGRWIVAVDHPTHESPAATLVLQSGAVATSTTTRRVWLVDGSPRHHVIDPATGQPSRRSVVSTTAVAGRAADAEVAATMALLAPAGAELDAFDELRCDGLAVDDDGVVRTTLGLAPFLATPAPIAVLA